MAMATKRAMEMVVRAMAMQWQQRMAAVTVPKRGRTKTARGKIVMTKRARARVASGMTTAMERARARAARRMAMATGVAGNREGDDEGG
jgi:hypothetical protein